MKSLSLATRWGKVVDHVFLPASTTFLVANTSCWHQTNKINPLVACPNLARWSPSRKVGGKKYFSLIESDADNFAVLISSGAASRRFAESGHENSEIDCIAANWLLSRERH